MSFNSDNPVIEAVEETVIEAKLVANDKTLAVEDLIKDLKKDIKKENKFNKYYKQKRDLSILLIKSMKDYRDSLDDIAPGICCIIGNKIATEVENYEKSHDKYQSSLYKREYCQDKIALLKQKFNINDVDIESDSESENEFCEDECGNELCDECGSEDEDDDDSDEDTN